MNNISDKEYIKREFFRKVFDDDKYLIVNGPNDIYDVVDKLFDPKVNDIKGYDERALDITRKYYGFIDDKKYAYEELGKEYGVTKERIRQIITYPTGWLRRIYNRYFTKYPKLSDKNMLDDLDDNLKNKIKKNFMDYCRYDFFCSFTHTELKNYFTDEEINYLFKVIHKKGYKSIFERSNNQLNDEGNISVDDLDLSGACKNTLYRHNIFYLEDIESFTRHEVILFERLGKDSFNKIEKYMDQYNIEFATEEKEKMKNKRGDDSYIVYDRSKLNMNSSLFDIIDDYDIIQKFHEDKILSLEHLLKLKLSDLRNKYKIPVKLQNEMITKIHKAGYYFNDELKKFNKINNRI